MPGRTRSRAARPAPALPAATVRVGGVGRGRAEWRRRPARPSRLVAPGRLRREALRKSQLRSRTHARTESPPTHPQRRGWALHAPTVAAGAPAATHPQPPDVFALAQFSLRFLTCCLSLGSVLDAIFLGFRCLLKFMPLSLSLSNAVVVKIYFLNPVIFGTHMRLDMLLGSARGCPGSTCISLCGWNGVLYSLSLSLPLFLGPLVQTASPLPSPQASSPHFIQPGTATGGDPTPRTAASAQ